MTTFQDIFKSSFLENVNSVSLLDMLLALALAFGLGMFIFLVYKKTFYGVMYSSSFGVTLIALTMITTLVILAVTSNIVLSLGMAVRKRTMDSAPTMPRESTTLLVTARITMAVIMVIATRVTPKLEEYITPEKVFLYTRKMNSPMPKASTRASAMSSRLTLFTLSRKLDLKISWNVITRFVPFVDGFAPCLPAAAHTP